MTDVRRREAGELEWRHLPPGAAGLRVPGRDSGGAGERRKAEVVVERTILLAVDDDMLQRRGPGPCPGQTRTRGRPRPGPRPPPAQRNRRRPPPRPRPP